MTDNNFIISRGNAPRNLSLDEEMNFMQVKPVRKLQNVNGNPLGADFDVGSPAKTTKIPTSLFQAEERTVLDEKTVCYVSKFDLQLKTWI